MRKELEELANKVHILGDAFRYAYCTAGGPRLPTAFATHMNEYFSPHKPITSDDVKISAAATSLHHVLAYSLCAPGEAILTTRPYYGRFELDFGNEAGVKLVAADTDHETCFDASVVDALEKKVVESQKRGLKIRALLIVNPHNPLGRCYPRSTLLAFLFFCAKYSLHLISDEIYALSVFSNPTTNTTPVPFTSILSIPTSDIIDSNLVHVTYGLSKDFAAAGLKIGALITRNKALRKAVHAVLRFHGASGPSVALATAMLEDRDWCRGFIELSRERIACAYAFVTARLDSMGVGYFEGGNAGFFVWADLSMYLPPEERGSGFERECMLAEKLVDGGVFLHPGEEHGMRTGWFRVVYTMEERVVEEGMRRLGKVLGCIQW
ncbi:pyridoxal phosphate-dependent transferase [Ampelomyces quisqualis]|uniref:Pyridoxal phosphate-dependent transferase n=1 Tax=Ampelomyces quisqualis TaxID=50730 RepID=A0A6A5QJP3_AMPQU|nr:pyridoxal phosphate-dependent transferase [Ampelomyces quisqualis]